MTNKGILFQVGPTGRFKYDGLPDFYQTTFHTERYVRSTWGKFFRVHLYIERGMNGYQDVVVMQNA